MNPVKFLKWIAVLLITAVVFFGVLPLILIGLFANFLPSFDLASTDTANVNKIAVVEIQEVILDSRKVLEQLYKQAHDDSVKGIVLRIDSPGGAVGPSQEIYSAVKKLKEKKPIIASMGSVAASGGLYASLAASKVLCQPGTLTGSIGVLLQMPNFTKIADQYGFQMHTFKSGKFKDTGNSFRELNSEDKALLQETIDESYDAFISAVSKGRNIPLEQVREFADGRVILGSSALELGLVDGYGDIYDAARLVFEELGEPLEEDEMPKLIYPLDKDKIWKKFFEAVLPLDGLIARSSAFNLSLIHI